MKVSSGFLGELCQYGDFAELYAAKPP